MKPFLVDVPVLILFFNRPQQLSQVFEQVRNARPSKLFLYQDGPRSEHDLPGIKACREVTDQIDWDCEVHRMYQEKNYGCDPSLLKPAIMVIRGSCSYLSNISLQNVKKETEGTSSSSNTIHLSTIEKAHFCEMYSEGSQP